MGELKLQLLGMEVCQNFDTPSDYVENRLTEIYELFS